MAILRDGTGQQAYNVAKSCLSSLFLHHRRYVQSLAHHFHLTPTRSKGTIHHLSSDEKVVDVKKWKKLDSRSLGIGRGLIPHGPWTVMKILRKQGFDAYLVGGCVRDLLLKKTPKDFDIITNANLEQIKKRFHRSIVVGSRFPICLVYIEDSITEVSSFETVSKRAETKENDNFPNAPRGCRKDDYIRWKNSLKRDFTVNSLFFDPFSNKIYDYSSGISDLRSLKLRTVIPAEVSFEEDCARILRGLRIAARLGLSFSKGTETAIHKLSQSISTLPKGRIFMELNYMLSYGAAVSSLSLLQKFSLLEIILPFHAAYLEQQRDGKPEDTNLLMRLLSNLDKVVRCDHPSDCRLWVGLLAFHIALVNKPQNAFVAITLASILYHGEWKEGIRYARENAGAQVHFKPELTSSLISKSDKELAEEVSQLAASVQASIDVLAESECLQESMSRYPNSSCSGLVFLSNRIGRDVAEVFDMLLRHYPATEKRRQCFDIDRHSLGKGFMWETRFVLGKIILETMGCETFQSDGETIEEKNNHIDTEVNDQTYKLELSSLVKKQLLVNKLRPLEADPKSDKRSQLDMTLGEEEIVERKTCQDIVKKYRKADEGDELDNDLALALENMFDLEVTYKEKEDEKPSMEKSCEQSDVNIMKVEENREIKKNQREDNEPCVDKGQESQDEEKKGSIKKKQNIKNERPSMGKKCKSLDDEVVEKKKGNIKNKRKQKDVSTLVDDEYESLGEVLMEAKDVRFESLGDEVTEKKKREAKKKPSRKKDHKPSVEKGCDVEDEVVNEKNKGTSKKGQLKIVDQRPSTTVKKKQTVSKDDKVDDHQDVSRRATDNNEGKQGSRNADKPPILLSSLFG